MSTFCFGQEMRKIDVILQMEWVKLSVDYHKKSCREAGSWEGMVWNLMIKVAVIRSFYVLEVCLLSSRHVEKCF